MAKMSYTKPAFTFQAIPLVVGGGTGCSLSATSAEYVCPVYDDDLGVTIFASSACEYKPADGTNICYTVPTADHNIYNS